MGVNIPNKIIVHHSAFLQKASQLAQINEWHKERGFYQSALGYFVGYHYLIAHDGTITQTKNINEEGCHTIGQNLQSIGVCMEGDFTQEMPTAKQEQMLGKLIVSLCDAHGIPYTAIEPHRKFSSTSCYGKKLGDNYGKIAYLKERIDQLRQALQAMLSQ